MPDVWFAIPGDPNTLTGGFIYARHLLERLPETGWQPRLLALPESFPQPTASDLALTRRMFENLPADCVILVDGLAFGALPQSAIEGLQLRLVALVHHPLALETGLANDETQRRLSSERDALRAANAVITTSAHTAQILEKDYDVASHRLFVAAPGTDPADRAEPDDEVPRLLTVATLTHRKAYDILVQALLDIRDLTWKCVSVGSFTREPDTTR